jgi:hypothetical protein
MDHHAQLVYPFLRAAFLNEFIYCRYKSFFRYMIYKYFLLLCVQSFWFFFFYFLILKFQGFDFYLTILLFLFFKIRIYYTGGFIVTIPNKLILYIGYITPTYHLSLPQLPPHTTKAVARDFFVLVSISIWNPSTIFPHLNLLHSPFPFHKYPPTHCTYFTVLSFVINIQVDVQKGFSVYPCCEYTLLCLCFLS